MGQRIHELDSTDHQMWHYLLGEATGSGRRRGLQTSNTPINCQQTTITSTRQLGSEMLQMFNVPIVNHLLTTSPLFELNLSRCSGKIMKDYNEFLVTFLF